MTQTSDGIDPFSQLPSDTTEINARKTMLFFNQFLRDDVFSRFSKITSINLSYNSLKTLPSSIFSLKTLLALDISNNDLPVIPVELGLIPSLKELKISGNPGADFGQLQSIQKDSAALISFFQNIMKKKKNPSPRVFDPPVEVDRQLTFSLVSYNILASHCGVADRFPFSPKKFLDPKYRIPRIEKELDKIRPDIICLQEVEGKLYQEELNPFFRSKNYSGVHCPKGRVKKMSDQNKINSVMGQATFIANSKFNIIETQTLDLRNYRLGPTLSNYNEITQHDETVIITILSSKKFSDIHIVVVNVHLYWPGDASEVRTSQIFLAVMAAIEFTQSKGIMQYDIILAGDFNACLNSQPLNFLQCNFADRFYNTYQLFDKVPEFTELNYKHSLPIDYIFSTAYGIEPIAVLPFDAAEIKEEYISWPGEHYPSDHIPIATVFQFKEQRLYLPPKFIPLGPVQQIQQPKEKDPKFLVTKPNREVKLTIVTKS
ncbi:Endonuclease/Exonuclease/phosphatase family protein [Tritrichomonas foetus]|uniref:Endonuclease/Exonuclease/phosphatase family protein n=1 Tax=Tritrichomonas foetus TaxID=1144522 RepID=A0A1J4JVW8_9EUKA|nr:Endonuclease/Exonuclease/phosphatase family protein [Tritrichomonas foetus]|eukprot:OHT03279.1 Endonuclease/Exonuclease/phosphatase family protein [Tritrichomonas foetus]